MAAGVGVPGERDVPEPQAKKGERGREVGKQGGGTGGGAEEDEGGKMERGEGGGEGGRRGGREGGRLRFLKWFEADRAASLPEPKQVLKGQTEREGWKGERRREGKDAMC